MTSGIYKRKKGFKLTNEHKLKLSDSHKGKKHSEETKNKLKGRIPWNKGKKGSIKHSEKTREQMSITKKGKKLTWINNLGSNNPNWKGGISKTDKLIRRMPEYKIWRSNIFQRDGWTCQTCQTTGCYVTAHHKKSFISIIKENNIEGTVDARQCNELWDIKNGITLCEDCHKLTDNYKGKAK